MRSTSYIFVALSIWSVMAGCSATQPPRAQLSDAKLALAEAVQSDAAHYDDNAKLLDSAKTKLAKAQQAMKRRAYDEAKRLAEEAYFDAKAAMAIAQSEKERKKVEALKNEIREIRGEFATIEEGSDAK